MAIYPGAVTQVALTVTNLDQAVQWYVLRVLFGPTELLADDSHFGEILRDIFGSEFRKARLVHLATASGPSIELFEFQQPGTERRSENFDYWKTGIFHFAFVDPEVEKMAERIVATGGKQRSKIWQLFPDKPYKIVYCEDPFGNIIEIYSHSVENVWSNQ